MPKKVTFGGVEVKEMSIDLSTHRKEIKNPSNLIKVVSSSSVNKNSNHWNIPMWLIWIILLALTLIFIYFMMSS